MVFIRISIFLGLYFEGRSMSLGFKVVKDWLIDSDARC